MSDYEFLSELIKLSTHNLNDETKDIFKDLSDEEKNKIRELAEKLKTL
jgi:hypothetical protein